MAEVTPEEIARLRLELRQEFQALLQPLKTEVAALRSENATLKGQLRSISYERARA